MEFTCRAFLFDLDGVLVDSRAVVERTWRRWAARHQIDPAALLDVAHGRRARDTLRSVVPDLATDHEVAWLDAAELADAEGLRAVPGAAELLATLPSVAWGVVTSCGRSLARIRLAAAGLPLPSTLVTSEEVPHGKPAPDGYLYGARRLGRDAAECLVFEDAPAGLVAGQGAGSRVVALTTTHSVQQLADADATIADFREVRVRRAADEFVVTIRS